MLLTTVLLFSVLTYIRKAFNAISSLVVRPLRSSLLPYFRLLSVNLRLQSRYQSILNGQLETRLCLCHDVFQKDVREQSTDSCRESLSHLVFKEHDTVRIVAVNLDHKLSASRHIRHDRSLPEIN